MFSGPKTGPETVQKSLIANFVTLIFCKTTRAHKMTRARHLAVRPLWQIIYHFEALDVSFPTLLRPPHLDLCNSSYDRLSAKRSGWQLWQFLQFLVFLPLLHASFPSSEPFLPYKLWNHLTHGSRHRIVQRRIEIHKLKISKKQVFNHKTIFRKGL